MKEIRIMTNGKFVPGKRVQRRNRSELGNIRSWIDHRYLLAEYFHETMHP